jgi:MFS family permease
MLVSDLARVPLIGLVPLLHALGVLSFPLLVGLVFLHGAFWPTYSASQAALLPALAGDDQGRLTRASALFQAVTRLTLLAGPALAGALIGWLGPTTVLLLDAATYLVAFLLVASCIPADDRAPAAEPVRGMLAGVRVPPLRAVTMLRMPPPLRVPAMTAETMLLTAAGLLALAVAAPALERLGVTPVLAGAAAVATAAAGWFAVATAPARSGAAPRGWRRPSR